MRAWPRHLAVIALLWPAGAGAGEALSGGAAGTVFIATREAYSAPMPGLDEAELTAFAAGRRLFRVQWRPVAAGAAENGGLGPLFNRRSCAGCHVKDGRGRPPEPGVVARPARALVIRLGLATVGPHPLLGAQLQDQAVPGVAREGRIRLAYEQRPGRFADGTAYSLRAPHYAIDGAAVPLGETFLSPRLPPALVGVGLLEAVTEATLAGLADPFDGDGDGISGRLARLADGRLGRFGWKATQASLRDQVVEAAAEDMGLASAERPLGGCTPRQARAIAACAAADEIGEADIALLVAYLRGLAVPARRHLDDPQARHGEALFAAAGCGACHVPALVTGVAGRTIHPYTDLLLHDMGEALADSFADGAAQGREWRTPALWGIGLAETVTGYRFFLHDGRARSLLEAVLWHGGEAAAAAAAVRAMDAAERAALIRFLTSL